MLLNYTITKEIKSKQFKLFKCTESRNLLRLKASLKLKYNAFIHRIPVNEFFSRSRTLGFNFCLPKSCAKAAYGSILLSTGTDPHYRR